MELVKRGPAMSLEDENESTDDDAEPAVSMCASTAPVCLEAVCGSGTCSELRADFSAHAPEWMANWTRWLNEPPLAYICGGCDDSYACSPAAGDFDGTPRLGFHEALVANGTDGAPCVFPFSYSDDPNERYDSCTHSGSCDRTCQVGNCAPTAIPTPAPSTRCFNLWDIYHNHTHCDDIIQGVDAVCSAI